MSTKTGYMSEVRKKLIRYSISFKQKVVREVELGGGLDDVRKRYGIKGTNTIQRWIRKFGKNHLLNQVIRVETMEEKDRIKALEEELKRLKMALADSLLAQRCLEEVIKEADKEYKTDLKKSFADTLSDNSGKSTR